MVEGTVQVAVPGHGTITAVSTPAESTTDWLFIYAPGAGSNVHDPFGTYASQRLAAHGVALVRFQFPYMEARARMPDRPPVLEATWREVIEAFRSEHTKMVVGGRSMGGRIASQVVATGAQVDALALFAYPLHPPGAPSRVRDGHLGSIQAPTFFCSGSRDAFGTPDELVAAAAKVRTSRVHMLDGADHGFATLKASGRTREDVWDEAICALLGWLLLLR